MVFPVPDIFTGGQMTDLPAYGGAQFAGDELMEIVSPGTAADGVNYAITTQQLASLIPGLFGTPVILVDEASYSSVGSDTRILVNNTMAFSTAILLAASSSYAQGILVKDIGGYASEANPITVTFSDGETVDGLTVVTITNPYGWFWFNPLAAGNFYAT